VTFSIKRFLIVLLCFSILACSEKKTYKNQFLVFGTLAEITLYDAEPEQAKKAFNDVENYFKRLHTHWHAWQGNGLLMQINSAIKNKQPIKIDQETADLIALSKKINIQSLGKFDPAVGQLIALWGFHKEKSRWLPPKNKKLELLLKSHPSIQNIHIKGLMLGSNNKNVLLDFGGIAKGYAIKHAMALIQKNNIQNSIVNAGGDICVIGKKVSQAWNIAIRHPDKKQILGSVRLHSGKCIMTSGGYERFHKYQGKKYAHIINPQTGYPADDVLSISVIDKNGALADASATALSITSKENWQTIKTRLGVYAMIGLDKNKQLFVSDNIKNRFTTLYKTAPHED